MRRRRLVRTASDEQLAQEGIQRLLHADLGILAHVELRPQRDDEPFEKEEGSPGRIWFERGRGEKGWSFDPAEGDFDHGFWG